MASNIADRAVSRPRSGWLQGPTEADLGLLFLRTFLGVIFIAHGSQKLFGWFGGYGPSGTAKFFESVGYAPGKLLVLFSGLVEFGGGILLTIGPLRVRGRRRPRRGHDGRRPDDACRRCRKILLFPRRS